ncbi:RecQ family ATP-dependent DNA helicase [Meridianimaribacter sp. CL38]|uniref:RecQ family ATP-dependent DNA helicase n=1 Tax=Meridianimaribacter sp. CL38 TaxID=2213021 RepID=UPI0010405E34|nr:RecQ family ATP-dependent DNA helicase [Meridianimaribacter sp. CL38]TBV25683.1 RecQ family ATP-dependent DNA helicase [Meridianimaribacter sp. CL38]
MQNVLFLDIETNPKSKTIDYGAVFNGKELHERNTAKLEQWIKAAKYICGHNIIKHDIPELKKKLGSSIFDNKKYVDTLLWSPLLFVKRPNHKLTKGYRIVNPSEVNNPLSDCKLTENYLIKELNRFNALSNSEKSVYYMLLKEQPAFNSFFDLAGFNHSNVEDTSIKKILGETICSNIKLEDFIQNNPVGLSYVFTLLKLGDKGAVLPPWVQNEFPEAEQILNEIRFNLCGDPKCRYCENKLNPKKALQEYFNYSDFRKFEENRAISLQEQAVRAGLQRESFVAVFPTGGGKSLTFQLPALMRGASTRHLTVVISPLISLMKDQVDNLRDRFGITRAVAINGLLSPLERQEAFEMVSDGRADLLYLSPESLRSPSIYRLILSRTIGRVVIDEAHCFSNWGQDFRVDYLFIADFIKKIETEKNRSQIPVSCFTATAKPEVIKDIKFYFEDRLGLELNEYITNKGRTNLAYEVVNVEDPARKMSYLLPILETCEKPVIIYASRTKRVEEISGLINEAGFDATFFHGKLDKDQKKENMNLFIQGEKEIIVATSAFGMGVDKENVKTVIHYNISDSLENYIQEAGRAGRDERIQAKCYILFSDEDLNKHFSLLQQTKLNHKEIKDIWRAIKGQAKYRSKISQSALEIAKKSGWDAEMLDLETKVKTAISALENQGFLVRSLNTPRVFADSLLVKSFSSGQDILHRSKRLTEEDKKDCATVLKRIITDKETRVDYLADITQLNTRRIQDVIRILRDHAILGDAKDLTAFLNLMQSKNSSTKILDAILKIEKGLVQQIKSNKITIPLRELNQRLLDDGIIESSVEHIRLLLTYWDKNRFVKKSRKDKERDIYEIIFINKDRLLDDIKWRHNLTLSTLGYLENLANSNTKHQGNRDEVPVSFSLIELKESNQFMGELIEENTKKYEQCLLYLNDIKAIKLEGGFMVSYNKLNISEVDTQKRTFTVDDYEKMKDFYLHRTEQIHIVGEYARKCVENYESALTYVNDYFTLGYEEFLARYFPRKKKEIQRSITPKRFIEIIGDLDTDQSKVINDNKSDKILVYAGPGSGKTKVLVHKIASLLLIEDIKPEQFLMLTFSKAAALEFKHRVRKLIPEYSGLIKINTFHGFCFQLLGQLGDLYKSQNVIRDCIKAIENDDIDISQIENKSILMFDEFQDINKEEWDLIELIIKKAENPRVIAVGDDDQNIYGFRGSSNAYMAKFRKSYEATLYTLPKNYRSYPEIVDFNNRVLIYLKNRLKSQQLIAGKSRGGGSVHIAKYDGKYIEQPTSDYIASLKLTGTKAVLTRTNMEALLISSLLNKKGIPTRLIAGFEGFRVSDLFEIQSFDSHLKDSIGESGIILEANWEEANTWFQQQFQHSLHFQTCIDLIRKFDFANPEKKLLVDWREYCREINMEDAILPNSDKIIVSTMHKSKGKEFDHVIMMLNNFDYSSSESRRLLYVASSRAKKTLHIHSNVQFYDAIKADYLSLFKYEGKLEPPSQYDMILNHKDVRLSSQNYPDALRILRVIKTGELLEEDEMIFGSDKIPGLKKSNKGNLLLFSKKFIENTYNPMLSQGYKLINARVEYIVFWYNKDDNKQYKIVLPRITFKKGLSTYQ